MRPVRYHDLVFQPDMLLARRDDGGTIKLTRQERALLLRLVRQPHVLVTRGQLLGALGDDGTISERNVDYLINRLRKRLGDSARDPRFLATQYGEGYIWVAEPVHDGPTSAFLVVGPVHGLAGDPGTLAAMNAIAASIGSRLGPGRTVACIPDWHAGPLEAAKVSFSLEASTHLDEEGRLHLALVLREAGTRRLVTTFRKTMQRGDFRGEADEIARLALDAIWRDAASPAGADPTPGGKPMHLRMHDAALMLTADIISWRENDQRLRRALAEAPHDPGNRVLLALNGYARLLQNLSDPESAPLDDENWAAVETEIEQLALGALDDAAGDPTLLLGIAKALYFVDRGHLALVERLTAEAFEASTAFAGIFAMKAQIANSRGDVDRALDFYDKAIELADQGTQFHIYLLVLKAIALMASEKRRALDELLPELYERDPPSRAGLGLYFASPQASGLPQHLEDTLRSAPIATASHALRHLHRIGARYFPKPAQRRAVLKGAATHLVRIHGPAVIPPCLEGLTLGK
jgi:DNA-binding winged helix-turn-helix (wHTH) protein